MFQGVPASFVYNYNGCILKWLHVHFRWFFAGNEIFSCYFFMDMIG